MSVWDYAWILWAAAFFAIEGVALTRDRADGATLSQHLRRWFRVNTHLGRTVWLLASGLFFAWFIPHILGIPS